MKKKLLWAVAVPCWVYANNNFVDQIKNSIQRPVISSVAPSLKNHYTLIDYHQINLANGKFARDYKLLLQDNSNNQTVEIDNQQVIALPTWSPNGTDYAYIGCKNDNCNLIVRNLSNEHRSIALDMDVNALKWSADGKSIYLLATANTTPTSNSPYSEFYQDTTISNENPQIYVINNVTTNTISIAKLKGLKDNIYSFDMPTIDAGFDINGELLAYAHIPCNSDQCNNHGHISIVNLKTQQYLSIPYLEKNVAVDPKFSPDGKYLAFRQQLESKNKVINNISYSGKICILNLTTQQVNCPAKQYTQSPVILNWSRDGQTIFIYEPFIKTTGSQVYAINIFQPQQPPLQLSQAKGWLDFSTLNVSYDNYLGFGFENNNKPQEAYVASLELWNPQKISNLQEHNLSQNLGTMETIQWKSYDGLNIQGVLIKPQNYDNKRKYPLLVMGKGGPSGAWSERYLGGCFGIGEKVFPACWQSLLNQGFVILLPNYRGSSGYGVDFVGANYKNFNKSYDDIMSGVDYLINQNIADKNHLALWGWSYDGYTTAWILGHTNRFKVAVMGDGLTDLLSFANTSDSRFYLSGFYGEDYLLASSKYLNDSPIIYANKFTTPLLIIHGESDDRVPYSQALELFNALQLYHKKVKFILLPRTGHVPTEPNVIYKLNQDVGEWLQQALD
ncbi:MAG TPA: prolyl oligopeptidase family serine peptidase [Burkholderiales bacterium]|nr:prolyl oligopeptidase family serine peptidase [Burkholderiales bacterium]